MMATNEWATLCAGVPPVGASAGASAAAAAVAATAAGQGLPPMPTGMRPVMPPPPTAGALVRMRIED